MLFLKVKNQTNQKKKTGANESNVFDLGQILCSENQINGHAGAGGGVVLN